jgi:hypothetical protein
MRMDDRFKKCLLILLLGVAFFFVTACGGGGDDSGGTTQSTTSLSYTGSTAKAVIDADNAVDISSKAVNGGIKGTVFNNLAAVTDPANPSASKRCNTFSTVTILQDAIGQFNDAASSSQDLDRAMTTRQETITGPCGGTATGTMQVDNQTGIFSGELTFNGYCDAHILIDGSASFSGTIDLVSDDYASLSIDFNNLSATDASQTYIFDGSIDITAQSSIATITINMYLQDGSTDEVFWLNNFQMTVTDHLATLEMIVSGTFYSPDHGYVTLSTQQTLTIDSDTMTPISGVLVATGENGSAGGPTQARLTCYSSGEFQVEADTDGDGTYDWTSEPLSWDEY